MITRAKRRAEGGAVEKYDEDQLRRALQAALQQQNYDFAKQIAAMIYKRQTEITPEGLAAAGNKGIAQGVAQTLGLPGDVQHLAGAARDFLVDKGLAPKEPIGGVSIPIPQLPDAKAALKFMGPESEKAAAYEPRNDAERALAMGASFAVPGGVGKSIPGMAWGAVRMGALGAAAGEAGNLMANFFGEDKRFLGELAALPGALLTSKAAGMTSRLADRVTAPSYSTLVQDAGAIRQAADSAGIVIPQQTTRKIILDLAAAASKANIDPANNKAAWAVMRELVNRLNTPGMSLGEFENLRKVAAGARAEGTPVGDAIGAAFDKALAGLSPKNVTSGIDPEATQILLDAARSGWTRLDKADLINNIMADAQRVATTGAKRENAIREGFQRLTADRNYKNFWSAEERELIELAAKGGGLPSQLLRILKVPIGQNLSIGVTPITKPIASAVGTKPAAAAASALVRQGQTPLTAATALPRTLAEIQAAAQGVTIPLRLPPDAEDRY